MKALERVIALSQVYPEMLDNYNPDKIARTIHNDFAADPSVRRTTAEMKRMRREREEQAQAQADAEQQQAMMDQAAQTPQAQDMLGDMATSPEGQAMTADILSQVRGR